MAEPPVPAPTSEPGPGEEQINVQVTVAAIRQPHGRHWVKLEMVSGNAVLALVVPPATALRLAEIVSKALAAGVDAARRADMGLVVAPANGKLPPLT